MSDEPVDLRAFTRETLLILWRTYLEAGRRADRNPELRHVVVDGLADVSRKLDELDDGSSTRRTPRV